MIAVAGNDPNILIYDPRTATVVLSLHSSPHSEISSISFHYTGKALVAGSFDQSMRIYDLRNATLLQQLIPHSSPVTQVAFHPFTDFLLSADKEGICRITNVQTDEVVAWMQDHEKQVWGVTWGSSGQCFATTGEDRQILTYKVRPKPPDAYDYEFDGGNMLVALNHLQNEFNQLTNTMKTLDNRLLIQEEKLQWLCDIDDPISKRMS
uniref:WD40 domain containing protein n=1 Tax=Coptotermes formosanus TaxID=36987 RepID=R4UN55_COPFO|nr:WD40 domain containing protein [Coptotermes formosanus]